MDPIDLERSHETCTSNNVQMMILIYSIFKINISGTFRQNNYNWSHEQKKLNPILFQVARAFTLRLQINFANTFRQISLKKV